MQHMQLPTCTNVRIRSTHDAHKIFFAVQQGTLHMVTRRLDAEERLALGTGCVYAWEERGPHTEITGLGIERFTEGRRWSPSRVRDEFLFYYEKYSPPPDANQNGNSSEKQPPRDWDPLVKQTYSVWVETEKGRRKWHLTAYFTQATVDQLGTIDNIPGVGELVMPDGLFKSTRVGKNRNKTDEQLGRSGDVSKSSTRTYAPFPSHHSTSQSESPPSSQSVQMYDPYNASYSGTYHPDGQQTPQYSVPPPLPPAHSSLPPIRGPYQVNIDPHNRSVPSPNNYSEYGRPDVRPSTSSTSSSRTADSSHRSSSGPDQIEEPQHAPYNSTISYQPSVTPSVQEPQQNQAGPTYPSANQSPQSTSSQSPPLWYLSSAPEYMDRQSNLFPPRAELPTSYPLRPSYPSTNASVSTAQTSLTSFPHSYAYPEHSDPNLTSTASSQSHVYSQSRSRSPQESDSRPNPSLPGPNHNQTFLPPLVIPEHPCPAVYEIVSPSESIHSEGRRGGIGPCRDLAPLNTLTRSHPYRRDPVDDKALRLLGPRSP